MERNFSDFSAAFSAFTAFARRKSLKAEERGNRAPLGNRGPNNGMSLERVTATLRGREGKRSDRRGTDALRIMILRQDAAVLTPCSSSFSRVSRTLGEFEAKRRQCRFSSGMMNSSSLFGDKPRGVDRHCIVGGPQAEPPPLLGLVQPHLLLSARLIAEVWAAEQEFVIVAVAFVQQQRLLGVVCVDPVAPPSLRGRGRVGLGQGAQLGGGRSPEVMFFFRPMLSLFMAASESRSPRVTSLLLLCMMWPRPTDLSVSPTRLGVRLSPSTTSVSLLGGHSTTPASRLGSKLTVAIGGRMFCRRNLRMKRSSDCMVPEKYTPVQQSFSPLCSRAFCSSRKMSVLFSMVLLENLSADIL
ncbi:hypothetical protein F7725_006596 [Dissostichus mawsoni]|uniref:Uncharacterized protein n=1 Tax=Dissostichus mawsoni TaxID=36200 RepID=A0A7J5XUB7_DISMA|nr:hypothetical protein F7725_006596 [Dissostichus mawsoni]